MVATWQKYVLTIAMIGGALFLAANKTSRWFEKKAKEDRKQLEYEHELLELELTETKKLYNSSLARIKELSEEITKAENYTDEITAAIADSEESIFNIMEKIKRLPDDTLVDRLNKYRFEPINPTEHDTE